MDKKIEPITFALKGVTNNTSVGNYGYYSGYSYNQLIAHRRTRWSPKYIKLEMCERGWHVVLPQHFSESYYSFINSYLRTDKIWLVAVRGNKRVDSHKAVFGQMKFISLISKRTSARTKDMQPDKLHKLFEEAVAKVMANPKYYGIDEGSWKQGV